MLAAERVQPSGRSVRLSYRVGARVREVFCRHEWEKFFVLRLGLSSGALYPEVAAEDVPAAATRMGLPDLELLLQTAGEYGPAFVRALTANVAAAGCRVHAIHSYQ